LPEDIIYPPTIGDAVYIGYCNLVYTFIEVLEKNVILCFGFILNFPGPSSSD
jgi:hypothetical protein